MAKPRPIKATKKILAEIKVMESQGVATNQIARIVDIDAHSVRNYLKNPALFDDVQVQEMVKIITERELTDLRRIGAKSRECLDMYLNSVLNKEKEPNPIAVTAIMDRSFQQRRLLEGNSTDILDISHHGELKKELEQKMQELIELKKGVDYTVEDARDKGVHQTDAL